MINFLCCLNEAGGMLLPTLVGHSEIWCGGDNVVVNVAASNRAFDPNFYAAIDVKYDYFLTHSPPCSFQGFVFPFVNICFSLFLPLRKDSV